MVRASWYPNFSGCISESWIQHRHLGIISNLKKRSLTFIDDSLGVPLPDVHHVSSCLGWSSPWATFTRCVPCLQLFRVVQPLLLASVCILSQSIFPGWWELPCILSPPCGPTALVTNCSDCDYDGHISAGLTEKTSEVAAGGTGLLLRGVLQILVEVDVNVSIGEILQ